MDVHETLLGRLYNCMGRLAKRCWHPIKPWPTETCVSYCMGVMTSYTYLDVAVAHYSVNHLSTAIE